jgi:hypothetical protein
MYERCEEYAKAALLLAEIMQLTDGDEDDTTWETLDRLEGTKILVEMYMKLERYEEAEKVLLDARDSLVPWERYKVKSFRTLLEAVRSKSAHKGGVLCIGSARRLHYRYRKGF